MRRLSNNSKSALLVASELTETQITSLKYYYELINKKIGTNYTLYTGVKFCKYLGINESKLNELVPLLYGVPDRGYVNCSFFMI